MKKKHSKTTPENNSDLFTLELTLSNGKTKKFRTGYEMYVWAKQTNPKLETEYNERTGPFLCDWFDRRRSVKN